MEGYDKKPIKRIEELRFLSHDHHHGLLLCWKIKTGILKNVSIQRIEKYVNWFFKSYLKKHFRVEEEVIFPVLGSEHLDIIHAMQEHKELTDLFEKEGKSMDEIMSIAKILKGHIRFEERVLFQEVQEIATKEELMHIKQADDQDKFIENEEDVFWV